MKILITGATGAFGSELAKAFSEHELVLHGRNKSKFPKVKAKTIIGDLGYGLIANDIINECKDVDVFINSTGVFQHCLLKELNYMNVHEIIGVNLVYPILIFKKVIDIFKERGNGTIININSVAGKMGNAMEAVYCAAKHGIKGFLDSVRYDCIQHGVRIIDVFSGAMSTGIAAYREGSENFINAKELAIFITNLIDTKTFFTSSIDIHRAIYEQKK